MSFIHKLKKITKKSGDLLVDLSKPPEKLDLIPSGSMVLDHVLGLGGWPRGRVVELCGEFSSSKSTLAMHACAEAMNMGLHAIYLDYEHAFDLSYPAGLGLDIQSDLFHLLTPENMEEGLDTVEMIMKESEGEVGIVVVDSVAAATPKVQVDREKAGNAIGLLTRNYQEYLERITKLAHRSNILYMQTNQMKTSVNIKMPYGPPNKKTSGGKAVEFYDSMKVELSAGKKETAKMIDPVTLKEIEVPVRERVKVHLCKSKVSRPKGTNYLWIEYGYGVNNAQTIIEMAQARGLITEKGKGRFSLSFDYADKKAGEQYCFGSHKLTPMVGADVELQDILLNKMAEAGQFPLVSETFKLVSGRIVRSRSATVIENRTSISDNDEDYEDVL